MSGLLQRLAAQARGLPGDVKPRPVSLFSPPGAGPSERGASNALLEVGPHFIGEQARAPEYELGQVVFEQRAEPTGPNHSASARLGEDAVRTRAVHTPAPEELKRAERAHESPPPLLMPTRGLESNQQPERAVRGEAGHPSSADASLEPNEVHVHIGRIEVTAVHETPRARPTPGRAPITSRLDGYLRPKGTR